MIIIVGQIIIKVKKKDNITQYCFTSIMNRRDIVWNSALAEVEVVILPGEDHCRFP